MGRLLGQKIKLIPRRAAPFPPFCAWEELVRTSKISKSGKAAKTGKKISLKPPPSSQPGPLDVSFVPGRCELSGKRTLTLELGRSHPLTAGCPGAGHLSPQLFLRCEKMFTLVSRGLNDPAHGEHSINTGSLLSLARKYPIPLGTVTQPSGTAWSSPHKTQLLQAQLQKLE